MERRVLENYKGEGGLFFFIFDLIAIASSYIAGVFSFTKQKLHFLLVGVNLLAVVLYVKFHPVHELLYISGILQHIFCIFQLICFTKLGQKEESLMNEEGYPYFNNVISHLQKFKEYVPQNNLNVKNDNMSLIDTDNLSIDLDTTEMNSFSDGNFKSMNDVDNLEETNYIPKRSTDIKKRYMDEISDLNLNTDQIKSVQTKKTEMIEISYDTFESEKRNENDETEKKDYSEKYNTKVKSYEFPKHICDPELLKENNNKMKSLKIKKKILFIGDILMIITTVYLIIASIVNVIMVSPLYILVSLNIVAAISASLISETCLDNIHFIRKMMAVYFSAGVFFSIVGFEYTFPIAFFLCAIQMFILEFLSKEDNYLKQQEGYPYFNEAALGHQRSTGEYSPEREIDFLPKKMDSI